MSAASACFTTPDALLSHWQAHRRLTRRVIEAFPEDTATPRPNAEVLRACDEDTPHIDALWKYPRTTPFYDRS